jgi:hypothetical protein
VAATMAHVSCDMCTITRYQEFMFLGAADGTSTKFHVANTSLPLAVLPFLAGVALCRMCKL